MFKKLALLLFVLVFLVACQLSEPPAKLEVEKGTEELILSGQLKNYLSVHFEGYRVPLVKDKKTSEDWKNFTKKGGLPPVYIVADFNGDKKDDIALLLMDKMKSGLLVSFHSRGNNGYEHFTLDRLSWPDLSRMYISKRQPGKVVTTAGKGYGEEGPKEVTLGHPGIDYGVFESAASVFYWKDGRYRRVWIAD